MILPEFSPGTFDTNQKRVAARYCTYPTPADPAKGGLFTGYTDVDRQTVLNDDDDGSLTGLVANPDGAKGAERETISVNFDGYFNAPAAAVECDSDVDNPPAQFPAGARSPLS